jgi:hypothetical protein
MIIIKSIIWQRVDISFFHILLIKKIILNPTNVCMEFFLSLTHYNKFDDDNNKKIWFLDVIYMML